MLKHPAQNFGSLIVTFAGGTGGKCIAFESGDIFHREIFCSPFETFYLRRRKMSQSAPGLE